MLTIGILAMLITGQGAKGDSYSLNFLNIGPSNTVRALNSSNQVIGDVIGNPDYSFIYQNGITVTFTPPDSQVSYATAINNSGLVAGYSIGTANYGYIYDHGIFTTFSYPGAQYTLVRGINDSGVVVGIEDTGLTSLGYIRDPNGVFHTFSGPIGSLFFPIGITDSGEIAGSFGSTFTGYRGAVYQNGTFTVLPSQYQFLGAINNLGEIVTNYSDPQGILRPDGTYSPISLPDNLPGRVVSLIDSGQILIQASPFGAAIGTPIPNPTPTPTPEPGSGVIGLIGLAIIVTFTQAQRRVRTRF